MQSSSSVAPSSQEVSPHAPGTRTFPIDVDHSGVRLAVPLLTILIFFVAYVLASWLLGLVMAGTFNGCIAIIIAIGMAALTGSEKSV